MHILVIFTGGTIGSSLKDGWISPDSFSQNQLLQAYAQQDGEGVTFTTLSPYTLLSEQLSATALNKLQACLDGADEKLYDGIVVAHGTDTLPFTAAALAFSYDKKLPLVLVSAAYPLEDARSNGLDNFRAAVRWIAKKPACGVFVAYKNEKEDLVTIHLAERLLAHAETSADLYSLGEPYALVDNQKDEVVLVQPSLFPKKGVGRVEFYQNPRILMIESYPENDYAHKLDGCNAVLLVPYHSGTLNTASDALQAFCQTAKRKGIPVFVVNQKDGAQYASAKAFSDLSIRPLPYGTKIAAYVKCWVAVSLQREVTDFLLTPLVHEFL